MSKAILIVGYGPGVSTAVAERFGAEGLSVALVARSHARSTAGVEALKAKGITAAAFAADASDPISIRSAVVRVRAEFGQIGVIHWNASSGHGLGDLLAADPASVTKVFDLGIAGLLGTVQEALSDLKEAQDGAVLVTNGAFGDLNPAFDTLAVTLKAEGVGLANAAKAKLVGLLAVRLREEGVFVGEVTIAGMVKGTGWASPGVPLIEGAVIADVFWKLYKEQDEFRKRVG